MRCNLLARNLLYNLNFQLLVFGPVMFERGEGQMLYFAATFVFSYVELF